jgi:beta-glucosidase
MNQTLRHLSLLLAVLSSTYSLAVAQTPRTAQSRQHPWSDSSLSPDERADLVLREMTLDEKLSLLHGQGMAFLATGPTEGNGGAGYTKAIPRLGIPSIQMADSAYGVARNAVAGRYSTALPSNLGAASSWDPALMYEYGALISRELRAQGYNMTLGGGVNLAREPRNGRTFEYQGQDPLLAGTLAGNLEKGIQSEHVIGDLKHYAVNDQETGRYSANAIIDKRALQETDLRAFRIALGISGAGAVMCAYNRVNGEYSCENDYLLKDVLRGEFHFPGFVLSDWGATHSAVKASHAGLDQEQPNDYFFGDQLKKAVQNHEVAQDEINEHAHRILRTMFAVGLFDHPVTRSVPDVEAGFALAQATAERCIVLLRNEHAILPLDLSTILMSC